MWTKISRTFRQIRSLLAVLVYRKSLTMAPKKELNSGQVVNLISGEAFLLADSFPYFIMGLSGPFQVVSKQSI